MGFYCVDNLPIELIPIFAELHSAGEGDFARAALLVDAREGVQLEKLPPLLKHLRRDHPIALVFIDASEDSLLRRYSETRRPHPLGKDVSVRESLRRERSLMEPIRKLAMWSSTLRNSMCTSCATSSLIASRIPTSAPCLFLSSASGTALVCPAT